MLPTRAPPLSFTLFFWGGGGVEGGGLEGDGERYIEDTH